MINAKAKLEFDLSDPDAAQDFKLVNAAVNMKIVIDEFRNYLRAKAKYENHPEEIEKVLEQIRTQFYDLINERCPEIID